MTEIPENVGEGACVFCGEAATFAGRARRPLVPARGPNPDGTFPLIPRPPVWMCNDCLRSWKRHEAVLGWCGDRWPWGNAFSDSPCREPVHAKS